MNKQLNLAVLQRSDPSIVEVVETAGHVSVYLFNQETKAWVPSNINNVNIKVITGKEGCRGFFICCTEVSTQVHMRLFCCNTPKKF